MSLDLPSDILGSVFRFVVDDAIGHNKPALTLPNRTIPMIAGFENVERDTYRTLASTSLVCKKWAIWAQDTLFEHVLLRTSSDLKGFLQTVKRRKDLADKVRTLAIDTYHTDMDKTVVQTLLGLLPHLTWYHIYLDRTHDGSEGLAMKSYLPTSKNPELKRMTLDSYIEYVFDEEIETYVLRVATLSAGDLNQLPHCLERLDLISIDMGKVDDLNLPNLTTLSLNESSIWMMPHERLLGLTAMLKIHLWYVEDGEDCHRLLAPLQERIEELHLLPRVNSMARSRTQHLSHMLGDGYKKDFKLFVNGCMSE